MTTLTSKLIVSLQDMVSGPARGVGAALDRLSNRATRMNGALVGRTSAFGGGMLRGALAIGAGYIGVSKAVGGTVGAAIKFEEAFADVRKVIDGTPAQLSQIRSEILAMSRVLPNSAAGIASIYAAAGQSNIPINELGKFSEMVAKVAVAWEVSEGETSEALAKIKNQLNMNVDQVGLYADAINQLGNNTAASAPNLVDFSKRVAAQGEMFGFTATQSLAFGGAMIAAGGETEVAATSFRNMGMALADAANAPKRTRVAFKALGLDASKMAKAFKSDAVGTMLDVFERIKKLPEHERLSAAIGVFGKEARALMPLINDSRELRRQLALVANEADYSGSAFREYLVRAETTGNALAIIGNKFKAIGIGIGDSWLPTIKELGAGIGDVLDTLEKRVGVLDQVKVAFQGFMGGIGYGGSAGPRELMNDLGDLLFGKAFGGSLQEADDRVVGLARLSNRFRGIGKDLKSFGENVSAGNVGAAFASIGSAIGKLGGELTMGGALAIGATGGALLWLAKGAAALALSKTGQIFLMAMAVSTLINAVQEASSLGEFVENLKELSALEWAGVAGGLFMAGGLVRRLWKRLPGRASAGAGVPGADAPGPGEKPPKGGGSPKGPNRFWGPLSQWMLYQLGESAMNWGFNQLPHPEYPAGYDVDAELNKSTWQRIKELIGRQSGSAEQSFLFGPEPAGGPRDVNLVGVPEISIPAPVTTQPSGTQDVRVTNPQPAPNITVNVTAAPDPQATAMRVLSELSTKFGALSRGAYSDGAN
ncbi:phage tail tape measure protein [Kaistia adipata]|uniref:phage tail tape measure protein n=1 Tax=Kaistia adipata TaxID=166954 RepID=UPI00042728AA|nr:phage tail tape measure protein [Kaistia adipata]